MSKSKFCVIGAFDSANATNGQIIKTIEIGDLLTERYGEKDVLKIDYFTIKHSLFKMFKAVVSGFIKGEKVILITSNYTVKNLIWACTLINKFFRRPIYLILIGAMLAEDMDKDKRVGRIVGQLNGIFLETETAKRELAERGLKGLYIMPNFKKLRKFSIDELPSEYTKPYRLIFMSRVVALKGVTQMINEIKRINADTVKYTLDIYGHIDPEYAEEFEALKCEFPEYIRYMGMASPNTTSEIMKDYFLHLFPTTCATEGQPASIIDSYFAALPVLSGRWNSCGDMVKEGRTGISFELNNFDDFREKLEYIYEHPELINSMRPYCAEEAKLFEPDAAMDLLTRVIDN